MALSLRAHHTTAILTSMAGCPSGCQPIQPGPGSMHSVFATPLPDRHASKPPLHHHHPFDMTRSKRGGGEERPQTTKIDRGPQNGTSEKGRERKVAMGGTRTAWAYSQPRPAALPSCSSFSFSSSSPPSPLEGGGGPAKPCTHAQPRLKGPQPALRRIKGIKRPFHPYNVFKTRGKSITGVVLKKGDWK